MGGTTCKASIVANGQFNRSPEYEVGGGIHRASRLLKGQGYVLRVPSIDIAEIGAGGGSILRVDVGGALHIGPESAGASPGPACYDLGGQEPTLTDANIVLGYLNQRHLVGGELRLDPEKAFGAIEEGVAGPMGLGTVEAAYGAHSLANASMMRAIRAVSSERGSDPRRFVLYAFGGAGPSHAVGVAKGLGIARLSFHRYRNLQRVRSPLFRHRAAFRQDLHACLGQAGLGRIRSGRLESCIRQHHARSHFLGGGMGWTCGRRTRHSEVCGHPI